MLRSIYIDNYALIERLEIDFRKGLTIITGETGAGKSILLGALGLLQGKRADSSVLMDTERKCVVEGAFFIENYGLEKFFQENELDYYPETIIRREILNNGKSRAFINDTPVNLAVVQDFSLFLIDIHSQHQNLALNDESYLRWIIDSYAGLGNEAAAFSLLFGEYQQLRKAYLAARESYQQDSRELDFMTHQFNELKDANLQIDELTGLEEEQDQMNHLEEIKSTFQLMVDTLRDDASGIVTNLKRIIDALGKIDKHSTSAHQLASRISECYVELKDIGQEAEQIFSKLDFDPDRYTYINNRIDLLYDLLRKFRMNNIAELITFRDELDDRLNKHASGDYELEKLSAQLSDKENAVMQKAQELSDARKAVFGEFENKVVSLIEGLGMENAAFSIKHNITGLSAFGTDRIQFMFSANPHIDPQNIAKVASGGELSRLMLAVKYLISHAAGLPTVFFDEIDAGVSGEIADKIGNLIKEMSASMQVINITHLPQVASKGDQHFLVYKKFGDETTNTFIRELTEDERLTEIAKMLSGDRLTEAALANARVLLYG